MAMDLADERRGPSLLGNGKGDKVRDCKGFRIKKMHFCALIIELLSAISEFFSHKKCSRKSGKPGTDKPSSSLNNIDFSRFLIIE